MTCIVLNSRVQEIITHGKSGYVVEPRELDIADAILDFYINNRKADLTEGVKEDKKRFGWDRMINSIFSLVDDIKKDRSED